MTDRYNPMSFGFDPGDKFWKEFSADFNCELHRNYQLGYGDGSQDFQEETALSGSMPSDIRTLTLGDTCYWIGVADGFRLHTNRVTGERWSVNLDELGDDDE